MTIGSTLDAQIAFLNMTAKNVAERVEKVEGEIVRHEQYTDEWLHEELRKMSERLQLPVPEILSRMNQWERELAEMRDAYQTLIMRVKRLEGRTHVGAA